jgi:hypothetical protein
MNIKITPIQQIIPLQAAVIEVLAECDFQHAVVTQENLDDNKFSLNQSSGGKAVVKANNGNFLVIKSNGAVCNALLKTQVVNTTTLAEVKEEESGMSPMIWIALLAIVALVILNQQKK